MNRGAERNLVAPRQTTGFTSARRSRGYVRRLARREGRQNRNHREGREKLAADTHAACMGRARNSGSTPSSSRMCAPSRSRALSCRATFIASSFSPPRPRDQNSLLRSGRRCDTNHEACGRYERVGSEHRGAQPRGASGSVSLVMSCQRTLSSSLRSHGQVFGQWLAL